MVKQGTMDDVGASYANALVDLAQEKGCLDGVHADIDTLAVSITLHSVVSRTTWLAILHASLQSHLYRPLPTHQWRSKVAQTAPAQQVLIVLPQYRASLRRTMRCGSSSSTQ